MHRFAARTLARGYATAASPSALVFLEHRGGQLNSAVLNAITAASKLGGDVTGVVFGAEDEHLDKVIEEAKKLPLSKILTHTSKAVGHGLAETTAPALADLVKSGSFTHLVAPHSAVGKNIFPRVAALLDVSQISDVMRVEDPETFVRPIYAGNAIATVKSSDATKVFTVRTSSFAPAAASGSGASVEEASVSTTPTTTSEWVSESLTKSERPELGSAKRIVSGGRGVKTKENFDSVLTPLADALGAAIGASRAAVDSGYADNSLQVGQTGKVVAPELYIAVGISGAIQHMAGMKDSKVIVAINKDPEAPIMSVADHALTADLFDAVPELAEKLTK